MTLQTSFRAVMLWILLSVSISAAFAQTEICNNGIDDDNDGLIDCFDPDCSGVGPCEGFFFGQPVADCNYQPPELREIKLNLLFKTSETTYPIDQRCGVVVGDMNGDGIPDLVSRRPSPGRIHIFSGDNGRILQSIVTSTTNAFGQVAIADVDRNGRGDIFHIENTGVLARYEFNNPNAVWKTATNIGDDNVVSTPQLADINQDGIPEVYVGSRIFDAITGKRYVVGSGINVGGYATGGNADRYPIYFDLFRQGDAKPGGGTFGAEANGLEYIAGNQVRTVTFSPTGNADNGSFQLAAQLSATASERDGFTSIADINGDRRMDIAVMAAGKVYAWDPYTNQQIGSTYTIPNTTAGGRINIGDFDGDGDVELGFAGRDIYVVRNYVDNNGDANPNNGTWSTLWQKTGLDDSSERTGSTLFDFDGNGTVEVVYSDQENLFIYDGPTGNELVRIRSLAGTRTEYPLVADINGNGTAEIIITAQALNGPQFSGSDWISVYESANQPWVPARKVWNQHGYNVTGINNDLTVPRFQQNNLSPFLGQRYNNFLVQTAVGGGAGGEIRYPAADAIITVQRDGNGDPVIDFTNCPNSILATLVIRNEGAAPLPASTPISYYDADPSLVAANLIQTTTVGTQVGPGETVTILRSIPVGLVPAGSPIFLSVNDPGFARADLPFQPSDFPLTGTAECDYTNNVSFVGNVRCGEICNNGKDDDGDGLVDEPNLVQFQSTGCPGETLQAITTDAPGGVWSVRGNNTIGTTVNANGEVTLGNNFTGLPVTQTIRYDDGICTEEVMVTTVDNINPAVRCPGNATVAVDANCTQVLENFTTRAQASDNCTAVSMIAITQVPATGSNLNLGANTVTITATDQSGNNATCTFTITAIDRIAPVITCPANTDVIVDNNCRYMVPNLTAGVTASDNCSVPGSLILAQTPVQGQVRSGDGTTVMVTLTATDEAGNTGNCTYTLRLKDQTPPVITCPVAGDQTLSNGADGTCSYTLPDYRGQVQRQDNCSNFNQITLTQSPAGGTVITMPGTTTVTITATDAAGNTRTCTIEQRVLDRDPPQLVCGQFAPIPPNAGTCDYTVPNVIAASTIVDNCGAANLLSVTQSPAAGTTFTGNFQNVTVTATDASGNSNICVTTIVPGPPAAPTITCPADQQIIADQDCQVPLPDYTSLATTTGCGTVTVSQQPAPGTTISTATTVTLRARNSAGNEVSCTFRVNVTDQTPPSITCPATQTIAVDGTCEVPLPNYTSAAATSDNCNPRQGGVSVAQTPAAGAMYDINDNPVTVTLTATDASGNTANCTFQVQLMDNQPPMISCPVSPQTDQLDGNCEAMVPDFRNATMVTSTCTMDGFTLVQVPAPGTVVTGETVTPITITASDVNGNSMSCTFDYQTLDGTPPTLTCPADQTVAVDGNCAFTIPDYRGMTAIADNCSSLAPAPAPNLTVIQNLTPGSTVSGDGTVTTITITATDAAGNASSCDFRLSLADDTAPAITCPADQTRDLNASCTYGLEDFRALSTPTDNCSTGTDLMTVQSPAAGSQNMTGPGNQTITLSATDEAGNSSSCTFLLTVTDLTPPTISCPQPMTLNVDGNCEATVPDLTGTVTAADNCALGGAPTITQDVTAGTVLSEDGTIREVVLTANDANGLSATCTVTLILDDATPPTVTCPAARDVELSATGCQVALPDFTGQLILADNCEPAAALIVQQMPEPATIVGGANTVIPVFFNVDDGNGNSASCQFSVTLRDVTDPVVVCPTPAPLSLDGDCSVELPDFTGQATTTDDCAMTAAISLIQSPAAGTSLTFDGDQRVVTITANDGNGNTSSCTFTVTAEDASAPAIACPADRDEPVSGSCDLEVPNYAGEASVVDNCSGAAAITVTQTPVAGTIIPAAQLGIPQTITLTATDAAGNAATCTFEITPVDETSPSIVCPPSQTILLDAANCDATLGDYTTLATVADNCSAPFAVTVTQDSLPGTVYNGLAPPQIAVVLRAEDESGNADSCTVTVFIRDEVDPTVDCSAANQVIALDENCNGEIPDLIPALVTGDNCSATALTIIQDPAAGASYGGDGTSVEVTFTVTDGSGNTVTCSATVTFEDQSPPDPVICPGNQVLNVDDICAVPLPDYTNGATVLDNCRAEEDIIITQSPPADSMVMGDGTVITVVLTADDGNGNTETCIFDVTLVDNNALDITCPGGQIVIASSDACDGVYGDYTSRVVASNQCMQPAAGATFTQTPAPGTVLQPEMLDIPQLVTITAVDLNGLVSMCTFEVTLVDTLAPVISCPPSRTASFNGSCGYVIGDFRDRTEIADNCAMRDEITVTQDPMPGNGFSGPSADRVVTITAVDPSGNLAQCSFKLTVRDNTPPLLTCPLPDTLMTNANCEVTIGDYTGRALAQDNCTAQQNIIIAQTPPPGTVISGHNTTQPVTITATDESGNTRTCVFSVTAKDAVRPVIFCPGDQVINPDTDCNALIPDYRTNAQVSDNCASSGAITLSQRPAPGTLLAGQGDAAQVTIVADDGNGNRDSCTFIVTLADDSPPTIDCPADKSVDLDADCTYDLEDLIAQADVRDNCAEAGTIVVSQNIGIGQTFTGDGTEIVVTLTADDGNGNTAQCLTTITLQDNTDPTISCPADQEIFVDSGCNAQVPDYRGATVDDNCTLPGDIVVTQVLAAGTVLNGDDTSTTITLTADDGNGNTADCSFTLTLQDNTAPTITCPPTQEVSVDGSCTTTLTDYTGLATTADNCSPAPAISQNNAAGTILDNLGAETVTLTANDGNGNTSSCTFMVMVRDITPPTLTCPPLSVIPADASCVVTIANYRDSITVADNCGPGSVQAGALTLVQSPDEGATFGGTNASQVITISATDPSGNTSRCMITVALADTTRPTIICPADTTLAVNANCSALVPDYTSLPVTADNCDGTGAITVTQRPVAGTMVNDEATLFTITLTATDPSGNFISCEFAVQLIDSIPPAVICPPDVTAAVNANCEISLADYRPRATAADNCSATGEITYEQRPLPGTIFSENGTVVPVTIVAVDQSGNRDSCEFSVTLDDAINPVIANCPNDTTVFVDATCAYDLPDFWAATTASATDNCTPAGTISTTAAGDQILYTQTPSVAELFSGGSTTQLITLMADDGNGNTASCSFVLSMSDTIAPVITVCPADTIVNPDADCEFLLEDYTSRAAATENCEQDGAVTFTQSPAPGTVISGQGAVREITITATDANGNSAGCSFMLTLQDTISPVIVCPAAQTELVDANCTISLPDYTSLAVVTDNCTVAANVTVSQLAAPGTAYSGVQIQTVVLTADDGNGNTANCSFDVSIEDEIDPVLNCPAVSIIPADANCAVVIVDYRDSISVTDNCDAPALITLTQDVAVGQTISGLGATLDVTITAEDRSGRTDICVINVRLTDTIRPVLVCARDTVLGVNANCAAILPDYRSVTTATDNCNDPAGITFVQAPPVGSPLNTEGTAQTITITATDASGNATSCNFEVTLIDTISPVVVCPGNDTISVDGGCEVMLADYTTNAQATDNCSDPAAIALMQDPPAGTVLSGDGTVQVVTITATDESGNVSTCTLRVTLEDSTEPTITCPADRELTADEDCEVPIPDYTSDAITSSMCDQGNDITVVQSPVAGTLISGHSTSRTITLTATDGSGNSVSCDFVVTLIDRTMPVIENCPADQISDLDAACEFILPDYWATTPATATDNCRATGTVSTAAIGDKILFTQDPAPGTVLSSGMLVQTITLTADDGNGNTVSCQFDLTLNDAVPPVITVCPADTTANPDANCEFVLEDYTGRAAATDNCLADGAIVLIQSPVAGSTISGDGTVQPITITATDANGNASTCTFELLLADTTAPTITCPQPQTEELAADCMTSIEDYTLLAGTDDNCDAANIIVTQLPAAGTTFTGVQTQTIELTADDGNGNTTSCVFTLNVIDLIDPELVCPTQSIIPANADCAVDIVSYLDSVSVTDNCDGAAAILLEQDIAVGTTISELGASLDVTITATDQSGNTDRCVIRVVLLDTIRPVLTCVPDTILGADAGCNAVLPDYRAVASATDNCNEAGGIILRQTPPAGTPYSDEATSIDVTIRATDATGNFTECSFSVRLVDTIPPAVICPQDQVVETDADCEIQLADFRDLATPADNCSDAAAAEITLTQRPAPGTVFSGATTVVPVTIFAEDQSGNVDSCTFMVELNDVTPPIITVCQSDTVGVLSAACDYTLPDYWSIAPATAQDNCRPTGSTSTTATGDQIIYTQSPPPGTVLTGAFTVTSVTLTADDGNGNTVSCDFELTLTDTISPTIACPSDTIANPDAGCDFVLEDYTGRAVIADNCAAADDLVVTQIPPAGTVISEQATNQEITLTVTDPSGNASSCTFNLLLQDTISPTITCPSNKVENLTADCEFTVPDYTGGGISGDNCTDPSAIVVTQTPSAGNVFATQNEGDTFTVTLTAADGNGNTASCVFTVRLNDALPPVINCPADSTVFVDATCTAPLPDLAAVTTTTDNCATVNGGGGVSISQAPLAGTAYSGDDTRVTVVLTANDGNGNTSQCAVTVTLQDTVPPLITCPENETLLTDGDCEVTLPDYRQQASKTDNCATSGNIVITQDIAPGTVLSGDGTTQTVTLTAADGNGNTSSCALEVTVDDNVPPTIVCPPTQTQFTDADCMTSLNDYTGLAVTADNCDSPLLTAGAADITVSQLPVAGTAFIGVQNVVVTLTADDGNGNTTNCDFTFLVRDNTMPQITCPAPQRITADASCSAAVPDYRALAMVTDNCSVAGSPDGNGITLVQAGPTMVIGYDQEVTVTITATDSSGNFSSCDFRVELIDEVAPAIVCPPAQTQITDADCEVVLGDYRDLAVGTDNCDDGTSDLVYVQAPAAGLPLNGDETMQTVTITATDRSGNSTSCDFIVTVQDRVPPTIVCPARDTLSVDGTCSIPLGDYTDQASVSDNCTPNGSIVVTQTPRSDTLVMGDETEILVTLTADDGNGNTASCSFTVELQDTIVPSIICPGRQVLMTDAACSALIPDYRSLADASTQCNTGMITLTQNPPENTETITGDSTIRVVTITATDDAVPPNVVSCTFEVILVDDTPPVITVCPPDETVFVGTDCNVMLPDFRPNLLGTDNCEAFPDMEVAQTPVPGTVFGSDGTEIVVTYTLDDTNGNSVSCTATVTLRDTISPRITCPEDQVIFTDGNCEAPLPDYTAATVTDNCTVRSALLTTQVNPPGTLLSGFNDSETVMLTVDDGNGNTASCSFTVTLDDDDDPEIVCPQNQEIDFGQDCGFIIPDYRGLALLTDNCALNLLTVTQSPAVDSVINNLNTATEVVLTVTDAGGNTASCRFTTTTVSPTPPPAQTTVMLAVNERPTGTGTVNLLDAFDNMATSNLSNIDLDGMLDPDSDPFIVTFYLTMEDAAGETDDIPAEGFDPSVSGAVVIARIEDPATGCFTLSQILLEPRTPGTSDVMDEITCNKPGTVLEIDGRPVAGGDGTTIVRHEWRLVSAGPTRITAANLTQTDQQTVLVNTTGLRSGTFVLEYQFFEDYGDGALVASVPERVEVELLNVGAGDFFWDGN